VHAGDDFLSEVAALGEVDSFVHDAGFCGEGVWAEVDVVEGMAGFDSCGVDGEPAGGFGGLGEVLVGGFNFVGGDEEVEVGFAGEGVAVDDDVGVVFCDGCVGVVFNGGGVEEFEGGGAVDGEWVEGLVDDDFEVFGEDEGGEGVGG